MPCRLETLLIYSSVLGKSSPLCKYNLAHMAQNVDIYMLHMDYVYHLSHNAQQHPYRIP
jgi:hypothetical protein